MFMNQIHSSPPSQQQQQHHRKSRNIKDVFESLCSQPNSPTSSLSMVQPEPQLDVIETPSTPILNGVRVDSGGSLQRLNDPVGGNNYPTNHTLDTENYTRRYSNNNNMKWDNDNRVHVYERYPNAMSLEMDTNIPHHPYLGRVVREKNYVGSLTHQRRRDRGNYQQRRANYSNLIHPKLPHHRPFPPTGGKSRYYPLQRRTYDRDYSIEDDNIDGDTRRLSDPYPTSYQRGHYRKYDNPMRRRIQFDYPPDQTRNAYDNDDDDDKDIDYSVNDGYDGYWEDGDDNDDDDDDDENDALYEDREESEKEDRDVENYDNPEMHLVAEKDQIIDLLQQKCADISKTMKKHRFIFSVTGVLMGAVALFLIYRSRKMKRNIVSMHQEHQQYIAENPPGGGYNRTSIPYDQEYIPPPPPLATSPTLPVTTSTQHNGIFSNDSNYNTFGHDHVSEAWIENYILQHPSLLSRLLSRYHAKNKQPSPKPSTQYANQGEKIKESHKTLQRNPRPKINPSHLYQQQQQQQNGDDVEFELPEEYRVGTSQNILYGRSEINHDDGVNDPNYPYNVAVQDTQPQHEEKMYEKVSSLTETPSSETFDKQEGDSQFWDTDENSDYQLLYSDEEMYQQGRETHYHQQQQYKEEQQGDEDDNDDDDDEQDDDEQDEYEQDEEDEEGGERDIEDDDVFYQDICQQEPCDSNQWDKRHSFEEEIHQYNDPQSTGGYEEIIVVNVPKQNDISERRNQETVETIRDGNENDNVNIVVEDDVDNSFELIDHSLESTHSPLSPTTTTTTTKPLQTPKDQEIKENTIEAIINDDNNLKESEKDTIDPNPLSENIIVEDYTQQQQQDVSETIQ